MAKEATNGTGGRIGWWRGTAWSLAALLLLLPLVAMQFTTEVQWTPLDFLFAAVLIGGSGLLVELAIRSTRDRAYRAGAVLLVAAVLLLIWLNAAVGMIGDEDNPLNLLYGGVIAVVGVGALLARFRPVGMARAATAAAIAQALVGGVALASVSGDWHGPLGVLLLNGTFVLLFAGAAGLFRRAR